MLGQYEIVRVVSRPDLVQKESIASEMTYCETPSRHGTKTIDVGTTLLQDTLSLIVSLSVP